MLRSSSFVGEEPILSTLMVIHVTIYPIPLRRFKRVLEEHGKATPSTLALTDL